MIVNARMYAVAPPVVEAWRSLFARMGQMAGVDWTYIDHAAPAPLAELWARTDAACVFICGLPYVKRSPRPQVLAAPVPVLPRYGGRPEYVSEFFVRADAATQDLPQVFGQRLACMLPESNSGYNAPRHHLLRHAAPGTRALFRPADRPTPTPLQVIQAVIDGAADVGVVDGYVMDLMRAHRPELTAPLRTIAVTEPSPIPLLMAAPSIDAAVVARVRAALWAAHEDAGCAEAMATLRLARFVPVDEAAYDVLLKREREADAAGLMLTDEGTA